MSKLVVLLVLCACTETLEPIEGVTSIQVELIAPTNPGSNDQRLPDNARDVTVNLRAIDANGELASDFSGTIDLYVHYLGSLTPSSSAPPFLSLAMTNGVVENVDLTLPGVFGPTYVWAEDKSGDEPTYATGTSPKLWYRDPFLRDVSLVTDEGALDAHEFSPLATKQVVITGSRHGDVGRLVITGVYAQGYTLADVACTDEDATPPCTRGDYDTVFVFTFGRPEDEEGRPLRTGQLITSVGGGVSEFNGLTELTFPQTLVGNLPVRNEVIAPPATVDENWFDDIILFERAESALIEIINPKVCPLDDAFETFGQWKLDLGRGCGNDAISVITAGQLPTFEPADYVNQTLPKVVGTIRPVDIGSFHVWIMYPRSESDITTP